MDGLRILTLLLLCLTLHAALMQTAVGQENSEDVEDLENLEDSEDLGSEEKDSWEQEKGSEELSTENMDDQKLIDNELALEDSLGPVSHVSLAMRHGLPNMKTHVIQQEKQINELEGHADKLRTSVANLLNFIKGEKEDICSQEDKSGTYITVQPGYMSKVNCVIDDQGKWTVIQRRQDGSVDFQRNWANYSKGFGDVDGELWLGNDIIHALTAAGNTRLRIDLEDWENNTHRVYYDVFKLAGAQDKYRLTIAGFRGSSPPGDALTAYHNGMQFSTYDQDNDVWGRNCALEYGGGGGWWYHGCQYSNLNGKYKSTTYAEGINWYYWKGYTYSLKKTTMMISKP